MIRALVVDDEPLARRRLQRALTQIEGVQLIGEAGNIRDAAALIDAHAPDLLLEHPCVPQPSTLGKRQQRFVRQAAPQEEGEARRQREIAEPVDAASLR